MEDQKSNKQGNNWQSCFPTTVLCISGRCEMTAYFSITLNSLTICRQTIRTNFIKPFILLNRLPHKSLGFLILTPIRQSLYSLWALRQFLPPAGTPPILLPCFSLLCTIHSSYSIWKFVFICPSLGCKVHKGRDFCLFSSLLCFQHVQQVFSECVWNK